MIENDHRKGTRISDEEIRRAEIEKIVDAKTDREICVAVGTDNTKDSVVDSIVNQHFQGRKLSDKQRWRVAAYIYDNQLDI